MEPAIGKPVGHLLEQGLVGGLPTPQPIEPHHPSIEVHLRPNQPIQPLAVHLEPAVEQLHHPRGVGPPDVDDSPPWPGVKVQLPPLGNGPPSRGRLDAIGPVATMGGHEAGRVALQVREVRVLEPGPDLRPARWGGPPSDSTADGTTTPSLPGTPAAIATTAAGSVSPTAPGWSARSGSWSTHGTPPTPAVASGPGTRPPVGTERRTTPPSAIPSGPPPTSPG